MPTASFTGTEAAKALSPPLARKVWCELMRWIRPLTAPTNRTERPYLTGSGAHITGFHPHQATVEPEAVEFVQHLVRESCEFPGPIVEVGTLLGVTTTNMALAKSAHQKIITVDLYCWNPWGLSPDAHEALTSQVLHYLTATGHVQRVRMDKNEFFRSYAGPAPAMVFLDAVHNYEETKKDIQWARAVGAKIIAGHEYCDEFPGVKCVVDEFGGPRELCASVWVL
jgi:Methyltransferase domain